MTRTCKAIALKIKNLTRLVPNKEYAFNPDTGAVMRIDKKYKSKKKARRKMRMMLNKANA